MKRVISFIILASLALCALISCLPAMANTTEGAVATTLKGSAVGSESEFLAMSQSGEYYLSNDITINSSYVNSFKGSLDGNGHKIIIAEGANI